MKELIESATIEELRVWAYQYWLNMKGWSEEYQKIMNEFEGKFGHGEEGSNRTERLIDFIRKA